VGGDDDRGAHSGDKGTPILDLKAVMPEPKHD
jgi:hypothetical protein